MLLARLGLEYLYVFFTPARTRLDSPGLIKNDFVKIASNVARKSFSINAARSLGPGISICIFHAR